MGTDGGAVSVADDMMRRRTWLVWSSVALALAALAVPAAVMAALGDGLPGAGFPVAVLLLAALLALATVGMGRRHGAASHEERATGTGDRTVDGHRSEGRSRR